MDKLPIQALVDSEFPGEWGEGGHGSGLLLCRVLRATNLVSSGIDYSTAAQRYVPRTKAVVKRLRRGDVILEAAGGGPGVPVGRVARFDPPDEEWTYVVSNFFRTLRPARLADSRFVYHMLRYLYRQPVIWQVQQQTTGIINLKIRDYLQLRVPVPPLEEQRRIAEMLDAIDETIQATDRVIAKLVVIARAIQDQLLSSASGRLVTLASIAVLSGGHGFPEDEQGRQSGSLPFYKVSDMNSIGNEKFLDRANNYVQPETAEHHGWRVLPPGAVVFAKVGAALLSNRRRILTVPSIIDNNMMAAVPRQVVSTEWLYRWLQTIDFAEFVQVGALPSVNQGLVGGLTLALPTPCEREYQTDVLDAYDARINTELAQLAKYKRVRLGLASDLLSGRVRTVVA